MSFQALARTWRPRRFDQLVGQEHVVRALTHALDNDKLHHALLFSGTRGVGKTTLARIIAKCLNCEHGISATPCVGEGACTTCREIDEGRYVDLIEVDAASRTGVDDTRELMDNVQYAPTRGRTKVYLIDEVHMLTKHSFNALLKTLEEPPPRVQFLLATTEPEKIPVTILSRCLQFPLKRLSTARIGQRLRHIVDAETLNADDEALTEIARAADGSMRDGLSLLDQAVAFGGGRLDVDDVRDMLGTIGEARVAELIDAVIEARSADALAALEALYAQGIDMRYLLDAMATAWQHMATIHVVGGPVDDVGERWQASAARLDPTLTQVFYDMTVAAARDYAYAPDPLIALRMCILRMLAFAPGVMAVEPNESTAPASENASAASISSPQTQSQPGPSASDDTVAAAPRALSAREAMAEARAKLSGTPAEPGRDASPANTGTEKKTPIAAAEPETEDTSRQAGAKAEPGDEAAPTRPAASAAEGVPPHQPAPEPPAGLVADDSVAREPAPAVSRAARVAPVDQDGSVTPVEHASEDSDKAPNSSAHGLDHPEDWHALVAKLAVSGFSAQLAHNATCRHWHDGVIELEIGRAHALLVTEDTKQQLQDALADHLSGKQTPTLRVHVVDALADTPAQRLEANADKRQQDAVASIENDPIIQQLRDRLGAQLRTETIKPNRRSATTQQRDAP